MIHALVFRVVDMGLDAQRILLDLDVALSHMIDQQQIGATLGPATPDRNQLIKRSNRLRGG